MNLGRGIFATYSGAAQDLGLCKRHKTGYAW